MAMTEDDVRHSEPEDHVPPCAVAAEHCWHKKGITFGGETYRETCCHCDVKRTWDFIYAEVPGHGPHAPWGDSHRLKAIHWVVAK